MKFKRIYGLLIAISFATSSAWADSQAQAADMPTRPATSPTAEASTAHASSIAIIPAGTRIAIRTIDAIDSTKNHVGDPFEASLAEPLTLDDRVVLSKDADVFGRLVESKEHGTFTGRSELRLELTGIVVNGQTLPLVTGEYELTGKSRGQSTAKRTVGMGAVGAIIGAAAGGGKGAGIGAASGAVLGAGSEIVTKGDQVKIPSETLLDFTLERELSVPQ
jgi:hypothetical protein